MRPLPGHGTNFLTFPPPYSLFFPPPPDQYSQDFFLRPTRQDRPLTTRLPTNLCRALRVIGRRRMLFMPLKAPTASWHGVDGDPERRESHEWQGV